MNLHYNQHHTLAEIESLTKTILDCIEQNHFSIALNENRKENRFLMINCAVSRHSAIKNQEIA